MLLLLMCPITCVYYNCYYMCMVIVQSAVLVRIGQCIGQRHNSGGLTIV